VYIIEYSINEIHTQIFYFLFSTYVNHIFFNLQICNDTVDGMVQVKCSSCFDTFHARLCAGLSFVPKKKAAELSRLFFPNCLLKSNSLQVHVKKSTFCTTKIYHVPKLMDYLILILNQEIDISRLGNFVRSCYVITAFFFCFI